MRRSFSAICSFAPGAVMRCTYPNPCNAGLVYSARRWRPKCKSPSYGSQQPHIRCLLDPDFPERSRTEECRIIARAFDMANASYTAPQSTDRAGLPRRWMEEPAPYRRFLVLLALLLAALALLLSGCAKPLLACPRTVKVPAPPIPPEYASLVFFVTDRLPAAGEGLGFSEELNLADHPMSYGSICANPAGGRGDCNSASMLLDKEQFLQRIRAIHSDGVLFVHGFNYTFDESVET